MHVDKKIRLVKYLGDKRNQYEDYIKRSVLGDIVFNKFIGNQLVESDDDFVFSMWDTIQFRDGITLEYFRSIMTPTNRDILDWYNSLTHNRWAQMRKLSRIKSKYQWDR